MLAFCRRFLPILALASTVVGCSGGTRPTLDAAKVVDSKATLVVADVTYALHIACYSVGDDVTAVGVGTDTATGKVVKALIQGPASPYVGLMFGDDEYIYEADANVELTIQRDGDRLIADGISFVRDIDLDSADGPSVGIGSVLVECTSMLEGTPPTLISR